MHSSEKLRLALEEIGLTEMAKKARDHYYNDYFSPLDLPIMQLVTDLAKEMKLHPDNAEAILRVQNMAINGMFDATKEEADAWFNSKEGKAAFGKFFDR